MLEYIEQKANSTQSFFLGIYDITNGVHIGNIKLEVIDWFRRRSGFGILIGRQEYLGKGYGTEATNLIVNFAFEELGLHEVHLEVIKENKRAIRSYEKSGFFTTEIKEKVVNHDGVLFDEVWMLRRRDSEKHTQVTKKHG